MKLTFVNKQTEQEFRMLVDLPRGDEWIRAVCDLTHLRLRTKKLIEIRAKRKVNIHHLWIELRLTETGRTLAALCRDLFSREGQ